MWGKKFLSALLALTFIIGSLSGCKDNTTDVLGMVGETPIYRWYYNAYLISQIEEYYRQTGVNLTLPEKRSELKIYKQYRLNDLVGEFAMLEEARKRGLDKLSAEQEKEIDLTYKEYYDNTMEGFLEQYGNDAEGQKQAEQAYDELLSKSTLTPERLRQNFKNQYILQLFLEQEIDEEPISEEEIQNYYDEKLIQEKKYCEEDSSWFGQNTTDASIYIPEGYIDTVRIMVKFNRAQAERVSAAFAKYEKAQQDFLQEVLDKGEDSKIAADLEALMKIEEENVNAAFALCYEELEQEIEPLRQELIDGADFIKMMELRSDDTRRISYFVSEDSTHLEQAYKDAALKLENVGDISPVVRLEEGVCVIMLLEKLTPGVRPLEDVREAIRKSLQTNRSFGLQFDLMNEYADAAEQAGIVTLYMDRL